MTPVERRLVAVAAIGALAALGISIVEPRAAASLLGLMFVLVAVGLTVRSLDQLVKRLPDFAGPDTTTRFVPVSREVPQAIDTLRSSMAPLRSDDPIPSPVVARRVEPSSFSSRISLKVFILSLIMNFSDICKRD